jgi:hypothetical protein
LPDGKLPNGLTYRASLTKQYNLINASDEMAAKFSREFKGSEVQGTVGRYLKENPQKARYGRRIAEGLAIGAATGGSIYTLGRKIHDAITPK